MTIIITVDKINAKFNTIKNLHEYESAFSLQKYITIILMTIHINIIYFFFLYRQTTPATLLTITETVIIIVVIYCMEQEVAVIMAMEEIMVVTILVSIPRRHHLPELLMHRHPSMEEPQSTCHHPQGTTPPLNQPIICIPQEFHPPITKQHRQQISMLNTRYMFVPPQSVQLIVNLAME